MTRHDMVQRSAAGNRSPVTDPRAPMVIIVVDMATTSRVPGRQHRAGAQRSGLSASIMALPDSGRTIPEISRRSKSP
jgi:hypothetical protein